jgi:hypothetical protein
MIKARSIIEVMGQPENLVTETLKKIEQYIKDNLKVVDSFIAEPKKSGKKFYTSFIEVTIEYDNIQQLFEFLTFYTPSTVEIIEPYELSLSAGELENMCNDLLSKIHELDTRLKTTVSTNKLLTRKLYKKE